MGSAHFRERRKLDVSNIWIVLVFVAMLAACSAPYYGYTKEEWDGLTPEQQEKAKEHIKFMDEQQDNRDLVKKTKNDIFRTLRNKY